MFHQCVTVHIKKHLCLAHYPLADWLKCLIVESITVQVSYELKAKIIVYLHESMITDNRIMSYKVNNLRLRY